MKKKSLIENFIFCAVYILDYNETNGNITFGLGNCLFYSILLYFTFTEFVQWNLFRGTSKNLRYKPTGSCETLAFDLNFFQEAKHCFPIVFDNLIEIGRKVFSQSFDNIYWFLFLFFYCYDPELLPLISFLIATFFGFQEDKFGLKCI